MVIVTVSKTQNTTTEQNKGYYHHKPIRNQGTNRQPA